ncbi:MAG: hypothetical protein V4641_30360 [Pseudomonadota bacterium]
MTGFQTTVNTELPYAVAGDFASANPRASVLAGPGGLVAGSTGVTVGKFAWVDTNGTTAYSRGTAAKAPSGFVHRENQALITNYLGESSMVIPQGFPVTLHMEGDFWAINAGPGSLAVDDAIFANYATGDVAQAAAANASATGSIGSTFTATGSGTNLTTSAVTGLISVGDTISGTGVPVGTTIVSQTSGTTGGAGVYVTSVATTASAATVTSFGNKLNITAVSSGTLEVGESVTGTGVPAGAVVSSQLSGAVGGVGVYTISIAATAYAASTAITSVGGVSATGWKAKSAAAVGELVKISTWG